MTKEEFQIEYALKASVKVLYERLATPSGLSEWFADDVNVENSNKTFVFFWDDSPSKANIVSKKDGIFIRFQWEDADDNSFFEFRIIVDALTKDVALVVTDFAEPSEKNDAIQLWNLQIDSLRKILGS